MFMGIHMHCLSVYASWVEVREEDYKDFLFIRHGQTPWGPQDILKGPLDLPLNEEGCMQARQAYQAVASNLYVSNPIIFSSSLVRAYETAEIFARNLTPQPAIQKKEGLKERYYGDYSKASGQSLSEYIPEDAEPIFQFQQRVRTTLLEILKTTPSNKYDVIIVVSHQKVFEFLSEWLVRQKMNLPQGGICYFHFDQGAYSARVIK
jgi:broad specificity phosphatase PhoE